MGDIDNGALVFLAALAIGIAICVIQGWNRDD